MKRYITMLLAVVMCVPLFCIQASAKDMKMGDVVSFDKLPAGFVVNTVPYQNYRSLNHREVFIYSSVLDAYLNISFLGSITMIPYFSFSNPESVSIRVYPCNGRDVFTVSPEHKMTIKMPAAKLAEVVPSISETVIEWQDAFMRIEFAAPGQTGTIWADTVKGTQWVMDVPSYSINLSALDIPITVDEFSQSHIDYYIVQRQGSGVETSIDYSMEFSFNAANELSFTGQGRISGYYVNLYSWVDNTDGFLYSNGAYYGVYRYSPPTLYGQEKLAAVYSPPVSVMNRFLTHFGYDGLYYSEQNTKLGTDIGGVGSIVDGWGEQTKDFQSQAGNAVNGVSGAIGAAKPIFTGVWDALPNWFLALLSVSIVFTIGRKILGR